MALPSKPTTNETKQGAREKTASHSVEGGGVSHFSQLIFNMVVRILDCRQEQYLH